MEQFTLHDRVHARKVAHLMWHILSPASQNKLTPPEIGMLVAAAHLHDLGMGLSREQRAKRLDSSSDVWDRLDVDRAMAQGLERHKHEMNDKKATKSARLRAEQQLIQAEEILLCQDTRARHATRERYEELLQELRSFNRKSPASIPDVDSSFAYDGISFRDRLIDVCVSHNISFPYCNCVRTNG